MNSFRGFWNKDAERQLYIDQYEELKNTIDSRAIVLSKSRYEDRWGLIHKVLGLTATISSALCAIFTLSDNQNIVLGLSITSFTSAACLTFLNPSKREAKWRSIKSYCSILQLEINEERRVFYSFNSSEPEKIQKLKDITQKLIAFEEKLRDTLSSGN
ncbi:hypothetical protein [Roseofilum capinflatum]|uniref:SMODS and SLOG-associating 2TM effector domain-containing protein n=1 Tax=Roseofilum capinflatum BLCC-M114 TaxID=3022440 RepID=A0ABT7B213_9CYAN|nr:hypothetical protein [Roseofilum capinflatum]MDJ1173204.1 hypothetical protein [Roseofilum capinflatum BLCC-M114]